MRVDFCEKNVRCIVEGENPWWSLTIEYQSSGYITVTVSPAGGAPWHWWFQSSDKAVTARVGWHSTRRRLAQEQWYFRNSRSGHNEDGKVRVLWSRTSDRPEDQRKNRRNILWSIEKGTITKDIRIWQRSLLLKTLSAKVSEQQNISRYVIRGAKSSPGYVNRGVQTSKSRADRRMQLRLIRDQTVSLFLLAWKHI